MNETSHQDKNLEELLKSNPANPTSQPGDTAYLTAQPIDREEIKQKIRADKKLNKSSWEKKLNTFSIAYLAITITIIAVWFLIDRYVVHHDPGHIYAYTELLLASGIFCSFLSCGIIRLAVKFIMKLRNKAKQQIAE